MAKHNIGPKNGMWKGGRSVASNGYVLIRVGIDHHLADVRGYAYEHRLVAEEKLGRRLRAGEQVHHVNENKSDNRPENIEIEPSQFHHQAKHRRAERGLRVPDAPNPLIECACGCGERFPKFASDNEPRRIINGHRYSGERNASSKLTVTAVRDIRRLVTSGKSQRAIAKLFSVSHSVIGRIARGQIWTTVDE